jgi:ABC-type Fe3+/spermidine/putrescine transport system ATPase subunit
MTRVVLSGLVKRFDRVAVVEEASLDLNPGHLTYLLGPSGAGKTTLARLVSGLTPIDEGEIEFDDRLMDGLPPAERQVGIVNGRDSFWPNQRVIDNVTYPLKLAGVKKIERRQRVAEVLSKTGLEGVARFTPDRLSPLQRQRVALARSLAVEPKLVIFDEPLLGLSERDRTEYREVIRRLHAEGRTTILVMTSEVREALQQADRLAVMDLGRIVQVGPPSELYNRPADAFVAQFLGLVNLLHGQFDGTTPKGETVVRTPIGRLIGTMPKCDLTTPSVTLAIRPEALSIGAAGGMAANRFLATVERVCFLGETRHIHLRGPGDWPVVALTLQTQSADLREGQSVTVSVAPEFVVVLPRRGAAAAT